MLVGEAIVVVDVRRDDVRAEDVHRVGERNHAVAHVAAPDIVVVRGAADRRAFGTWHLGIHDVGVADVDADAERGSPIEGLEAAREDGRRSRRVEGVLDADDDAALLGGRQNRLKGFDDAPPHLGRKDAAVRHALAAPDVDGVGLRAEVREDLKAEAVAGGEVRPHEGVGRAEVPEAAPRGVDVGH